MIKHLQKLFSLAVLFASANVIAQPSLTGANSNPVVGDVFIWKRGSYVSPGSAGASQTWNLSALNGTATINYSVVVPGSTPYGASFPSANLSITDGTEYVYQQGSASNYLYYGSRTGSVTLAYSNPETHLTYPFNYTNTFTDSWNCNFISASINFTRTGTSTVTADGYGTCITPAGTFANVMRVHWQQNYKDTTMGMTIFYKNDEYIWYRPGTHYAIAFVNTFTTTTFSTPQVITNGGYLQNVVTGTEEVSNLFNRFNVYPNPTADALYLNAPAGTIEKTEFVVCNSLGQEVKVINGNDVSVTNEYSQLNVSDLVPGIYFLRVRYEDSVIKNQRFVIAR